MVVHGNEQMGVGAPCSRYSASHQPANLVSEHIEFTSFMGAFWRRHTHTHLISTVSNCKNCFMLHAPGPLLAGDNKCTLLTQTSELYGIDNSVSSLKTQKQQTVPLHVNCCSGQQ